MDISHVFFGDGSLLSLAANNKNDKSFNVISGTTLSDPQSKEKNYWTVTRKLQSAVQHTD